MTEEGWYTDPFRRHDARWFSDGSPTALVRDAGVTAQDPPPDTSFVVDPQGIDDAPSLAADDLRRAGEESDDPGAGVDAVWTYFTRSSGGF
jgi:hypothetical protein